MEGPVEVDAAGPFSCRNTTPYRGTQLRSPTGGKPSNEGLKVWGSSCTHSGLAGCYTHGESTGSHTGRGHCAPRGLTSGLCR